MFSLDRNLKDGHMEHVFDILEALTQLKDHISRQNPRGNPIK